MKKSIEVNWLDNMSFEASVEDHKITIDAAESVGGQNKGPTPKPLLMVSLAGCTAMDVVSILKKMRVSFDSFKVRVEGDLTEEHPKKYTKIHVIYEFKGKNLPEDKIKKAISLSEERYCGVSATLEGHVELSSEYKLFESD